jgi:hypothetical protein
MNEDFKKLALLSGMKLKEFYSDEKRTVGWIIINCTEFELERYTKSLIDSTIKLISEKETTLE